MQDFNASLLSYGGLPFLLWIVISCIPQTPQKGAKRIRWSTHSPDSKVEIILLFSIKSIAYGCYNLECHNCTVVCRSRTLPGRSLPVSNHAGRMLRRRIELAAKLHNSCRRCLSSLRRHCWHSIERGETHRFTPRALVFTTGTHMFKLPIGSIVAYVHHSALSAEALQCDGNKSLDQCELSPCTHCSIGIHPRYRPLDRRIGSGFLRMAA